MRPTSPSRRYKPSRFEGMGRYRHRVRGGDGPSEGRTASRSPSPGRAPVLGTEFTQVSFC